MGKVIQFPTDARPKIGFERVKSTYSVQEIRQQFGLDERYIRQWATDGLIQTPLAAEGDELRFDFRALGLFRRVRELRGQGLTFRQIDAELRGQLNLFGEPRGQLLELPLRLSPFEEALLLHERGDGRAGEAYRRAVQAGDYVADAYCNLGIWEFEAGHTSRAFDCFTRSLKEDSRHFESHFNLAFLYFEAGDLKLARLHYELAAEIEPSFPNLHFNLGLVHAMNGDLGAAIASLKRTKALAPEEEGAKVDELLASIEKAISSGSP